MVTLDLDVGRDGTVTAGDAMRILVQAWQAKQIPSPSWTALSGRGAYSLWRLRDPAGGIPRNTGENQRRWKQIQKRLFAITKDLKLEPDPQALNLNRWIKSPGTKDVFLVDGKNTKSGADVAYLQWFDARTGKPPVYTFDDLEDFLGIVQLPEPPREPELDERRVTRRLNPTDDRNGSYVWRARAREILDLSNYRRGMSEGVRHSTLFFYFSCVRFEYLCINPQATAADAYQYARAATYKLNESFAPPLLDEAVERAIARPRSSTKTRWKAATLAERLKVTVAEVEELGLYSIAPTEMRQKRRQEERDAKEKAATVRRLSAHDTDMAILKNLHLGDLDIARLLGDPARRVYVYQRRKMLRADGKIPAASMSAEQLDLPP